MSQLAQHGPRLVDFDSCCQTKKAYNALSVPYLQIDHLSVCNGDGRLQLYGYGKRMIITAHLFASVWSQPAAYRSPWPKVCLAGISADRMWCRLQHRQQKVKRFEHDKLLRLDRLQEASRRQTGKLVQQKDLHNLQAQA